MADILTCDEFRALSAYYKHLRREIALPTLKQRKDALKRDLGILYRQHAAADKHNQQIIENNMRPLQWQYQDVCAQLAVIESDLQALIVANGGELPAWYPVLKEAV